MGQRADGRGLFYAGKSHTVVSETEGGKTWFALSVVLDEIQAGNNVLYIDFEDDEGTIVGRLLTLAAKPDLIRRRFCYMRPDAPLRGGHIGELLEVLTDTNPTLAILDGVTEAVAIHGLDPNNNLDAARFGATVTTRLATTGAAVVSLDHVVKAREGRGRYALGAVHKLNGLSGAQYILENRIPLGVGVTGRSTVKIAKDRPGQLRTHALPSAGGLAWYGDLVLTSHYQASAEIAIEPPQEGDKALRPTAQMARVSAALQQHTDPMSGRKIENTVTGKSATIRSALHYLILDGYVTDTSPHTLIKPYTEELGQ